MFLNGRWLGSDQKVGVGTKYSRPEGLSVSRADYRTSLQICMFEFVPTFSRSVDFADYRMLTRHI